MGGKSIFVSSILLSLVILIWNLTKHFNDMFTATNYSSFSLLDQMKLECSLYWWKLTLCLCAVFEETPLSRLEASGCSLVEAQSLRLHGPQPLVQALSTLLLGDKLTAENRKGLFIDWLVQLEPEIIGVSSSTQASNTVKFLSKLK